MQVFTVPGNQVFMFKQESNTKWRASEKHARHWHSAKELRFHRFREFTGIFLFALVVLFLEFEIVILQVSRIQLTKEQA